MISESNNQGRFHLLSIILIPVNLTAIFLIPQKFWWVKLLILVASVYFTFLVLRRRTSSQ